MSAQSFVLRTVALLAVLGTCGSVSADPAADRTAAGQQVFGHWCAGCHADTPFAPGTIALKATRGADRAVIERRRDLPGDYIRALVRKGFAGMPSFRRTEIGAAELDALVGYLAMPGTGHPETGTGSPTE